MSTPTTCAPLTRLGAILASGEDARTFLQGQLTADLRRISPQQSLLAAWCNPQGRVLFLMHVLERPEGFVLVLPRSEIERALKRLRMFVLRARVTLQDLGETWSLLGLGGETPPAPANAVMALPAFNTAHEGPLSACRLPGSAPRCWVLGMREALDAWRLGSALAPVDEARWWAEDTALGLPRIEGAAAERFLPQQLNLDRLGVMSFDKGCYPGQEIIARLKYRGQVKARLRSGEAPQPTSPGARLYRPDAAPGQSAGEVVSVAAQGEHVVFTAVVDVDAAGPLHLEAPDGPLVTLAPDPGD